MDSKSTHHDKKHRYVITLAGGGGKRLWPLSRTDQPKQLLPLYGSVTLLEKTIERMQVFAPRERQYLVTIEAYVHDIQRLIADRIGTIIPEPVGRNTAPAIALSCLEIIKHDSEAVVIIVPADHVIHDEEKFATALELACGYAHAYDKLVLLGVKPDRAATEYGYIETLASATHKVLPVIRFHEKPTAHVADWYYHNENMLWNSGIICAKASVLLDEITLHAPEIIAGIGQYETLQPSSIDYAVLEKSERVAVVSADFGWSDVGSLSSFMAAYADKNQPTKSINVLAAADNRSIAKKPVVFAGVTNVCIIETDDLIFVVDTQQMHRSAEIAEYLAAQGFREYT